MQPQRVRTMCAHACAVDPRMALDARMLQRVR